MLNKKTTSLIVLLFLTLCKFVDGQSYNEILGRPTDSAITMSILFDQQAEVYWKYGTTSGVYSVTTNTYIASADTTLMVDFSNLMPDTKYYYRTKYRLNGSSGAFNTGSEHSFHTQRALGSTFTFTIEADEHLCDIKGVRSLFQVCLENQALDQPDFMLSLGDNFGNDHNPTTITSNQLDSLHKMYRPFFGSICHSIPLYLCLGNHEGENNYYLSQTPPENMAVYATLWRKFYYPNPHPDSFYTGNLAVEPYGIGNPENYYAWNWGNALFVVMDVYRNQCDTSPKPKKWNWSLGFTQYTWLKNTLENSNAQYKFVFAHHTRGEGRGGVTTAPFYEWGGYEANGSTWGFNTNRPGWAKPIHQLFVDNGVNVFFQGHDHLFAHEELDGVIYQELPMAADSTYKIGMLANANAYVSDTLDGSGHLRVKVSPDCVTVDYIRAYLAADTVSGIHHNREVAFSYSFGNCPTTGLDETDDNVSAKIFPNPASNRITIDLSDENGNLQVNLLNILGQRLVQTQSTELNVSSFPNGIYFLSIETSKGEIKKKLIINR